METRGIFRNIDFIIFLVTTVLVMIGLVNIYSAEYTDGASHVFDFNSSFGKQLIWVGISFVVVIAILVIDARFFINLSYLFYGITILLLIATLVIGTEVAGSKSWIIIGNFSIQPAEFAKFGTALALAKYLDAHNVNVSRFRDSLIAFLIILLPMGLIVLQNDIGSALVFLSFVLLLYRYGLSPAYLIVPFVFGLLFILVLVINIYIIIGVLVLVAILLFWQSSRKFSFIMLLVFGLVLTVGFLYSVDYVFNNVLQPHQQSRINVLLGKEQDLQGAGYNVHQSLIAIGSGGATGKGFLNGTQTKFNFIPEQTTDFIFCTVAEEYGLLGSSFLILLFAVLMLRILIMSENQKFEYIRAFGYGVVGVFLIHFLVNLGMTLGLFPVIGIPLPFISYGGSSLLGFSILIALFLKFDADYKHYFN